MNSKFAFFVFVSVAIYFLFETILCRNVAGVNYRGRTESHNSMEQ